MRSTVVEADRRSRRYGAMPKVSPAVRAWRDREPAPRAHELTPEAWQTLQQVSTATLTRAARAARDPQHVHRTACARRGPDLRLLGYAYTLRYVPLREDVRDADTAPS